MAPDSPTIPAGHSFQRRGSTFREDLIRHHTKKNAWAGPPLEVEPPLLHEIVVGH